MGGTRRERSLTNAAGFWGRIRAYAWDLLGLLDGNEATGLMQVKLGTWQGEASKFGYDLNTPEGQIGMAAAILGGDVADTNGTSPVREATPRACTWTT
jgi:hypothetical protein